MRKYWNALRYGNRKTKGILWTAIGLFLFMLAGIVLFAAGAGAVWALAAVFSFMMIIVLLQSVRFVEVKMKPGSGKGRNSIRDKTFESLSDLTQDDIEQLFITYKVNKSHTPVVIEEFEEEKVLRTPGYLWKDKGYLHLLVLEEKPRNIAVSLRRVTGILCKRDVMAYPVSEYDDVRRPSAATLVFQELLPTYTERTRAGGKRYFTKNVYMIAPGIGLTNTSVRNAQKILQLPITYEELEEGTDSKYYKEARRMKMLLVDKILTPGEYKSKMRSLLKEMEAGEGSREEFLADIERMVRARLLTREVAAYFVERVLS